MLDLDVLDLSYIPDKLFMRNDAIKSLIFTFRRIVFEKNLSTNCLLIGPDMLNKLPKEPYFEYIEIIEKLRIPELLTYTSVLLALNNSETTTVEKVYLEYNKIQ